MEILPIRILKYNFFYQFWGSYFIFDFLFLLILTFFLKKLRKLNKKFILYFWFLSPLEKKNSFSIPSKLNKKKIKKKQLLIFTFHHRQ